LNYQYYQHIQMLEQRILNLEINQQNLYRDYLLLKNQLEQIKPVRIDHINYKIQELVVTELSGTLNIGLSALTDEDQLKNIMADANNKEDIHLEDLAEEHTNESKSQNNKTKG
jgi:spore germination protein PC